MTKEEEKRVIDIYGSDYEEKDIPTYIRNRDFKNEMDQIEAEERTVEELEDERFDYHPRPEEVN
jgi:hypothetical protein